MGAINDGFGFLSCQDAIHRPTTGTLCWYVSSCQRLIVLRSFFFGGKKFHPKIWMGFLGDYKYVCIYIYIHCIYKYYITLEFITVAYIFRTIYDSIPKNWMGPNRNGPRSLSKLRSSYGILSFWLGVRSLGPTVGDVLERYQYPIGS